MRSNVQLYTLICAACLLASAAPVYADKGGGDDPGHGHGPPHPPGPPNPPPAPPTPPDPDHVKAQPPQGVCTDSTVPIDLQGPQGQSGASHVAHTDFVKLDAAGNVVASDSSARMMYDWYASTFDYVLNGHQLTAGSQWTLTYQPGGTGMVICLGGGTVNGGGELHLANSIDLKSNLPPNLDPTADPSTQPPDALLALVPTADVDCTAGAMKTAEPDKYLWSQPRVRYIDTNLLPKTTP